MAQPFEQTYTYDSLNRLQDAKEMVGTTQTWKQTFQYDRFGNRRFDANNTTTLGSCSQAVCNPLINTSDNQIQKDQKGDQIKEYDFDANGNLTRDAQSKKFTYDAENHQTRVETVDANGNPISTNGEYLYDGEGKRVKKISAAETTIFVYNGGGKLVAEYSTAMATTPQFSYLTTDHLGSPRVITDQNGAVTNRKDFSAFGEETISAQRTAGLKYQPDNIRQDYTGYQKDDESGLEYAQARYYNPGHGRFTSVDPLTASASIKNPQTFNRYSYVLNSPYKFVDPLGLLSSSTGACAQWCPGSEEGGGSFGGGGYRDVSGNFLTEPETITVDLNIVYDASQFSAQQAADALKPQIQDLAATYGQIKIEFNITFTAGTVNAERTRITSGAVEGSINAFFFNDSKALYSYSKTETGSRQVFLSQVNGDPLPVRALSHEIGHVFGFIGKVTNTAVRVFGENGSNFITNGADNLYSDAVINSNLAYLREGKAQYGTDWVDDYRSVIEASVGAQIIPNTIYSRSKAGNLPPTGPRIPTSLGCF